MLTELRTEISTALEAAGISSVEYTSEAIRPPVAAVVPGEPYLTWPAEFGDPSTFAAPMRVHHDVLLLIARKGSGKREAGQIDQMVETAVAALSTDERRITRVTQPGVVSLGEDPKKRVEFIGAVIQIHQDTSEPEAP